MFASPSWAARITASYLDGSSFFNRKPYMLAFADSPVSMVMRHVWFIGIKWALRRNCRRKHGETSFSPSNVFLFSRNSRVRFWG